MIKCYEIGDTEEVIWKKITDALEEKDSTLQVYLGAWTFTVKPLHNERCAIICQDNKGNEVVEKGEWDELPFLIHRFWTRDAWKF